MSCIHRMQAVKDDIVKVYVNVSLTGSSDELYFYEGLQTLLIELHNRR